MICLKVRLSLQPVFTRALYQKKNAIKMMSAESSNEFFLHIFRRGCKRCASLVEPKRTSCGKREKIWGWYQKAKAFPLPVSILITSSTRLAQHIGRHKRMSLFSWAYIFFLYVALLIYDATCCLGRLLFIFILHFASVGRAFPLGMQQTEEMSKAIF